MFEIGDTPAGDVSDTQTGIFDLVCAASPLKLACDFGNLRDAAGCNWMAARHEASGRVDHLSPPQ